MVLPDWVCFLVSVSFWKFGKIWIFEALEILTFFLYCLTIAAFPNGPTLTGTAKQCQPVSNTSFDNDDQAQIFCKQKSASGCDVMQHLQRQKFWMYIWLQYICKYELLMIPTDSRIHFMWPMCIHKNAVCFTQKMFEHAHTPIWTYILQ